MAQLEEYEPIAKPPCWIDGQFTFLNLTGTFSSWNDVSRGMLWAYNLNYMDWLCQSEISFEQGREWINRFIAELPDNRVGLDPYPIALRGINWIKFISRYYDAIPSDERQSWHNSLYAQYRLLNRKLEYHLLGNHLLEDAYSLFIGSLYFQDPALYKKSTRILRRELNEQILPDGAHYEQSPMYHCILLDRLLDGYNFSSRNLRFPHQPSFNDFLKSKAIQMLGHLDAIVYADASIPLLNDSAYGIAPSPSELFEYARRLQLNWSPVEMQSCGYRKLSNHVMEAIVDIGNMTASYQPGHSHADTFNYELRINGRPLIIDSGISTYEKTARRQWERSTEAHNTVTVNNRNSSEVWGGFRVGNRAHVTILKESPHLIIAEHDGFGKQCNHQRIFEMTSQSFEITDTLPHATVGKSHLHFAPGVQVYAYDSQNISTNKASIQIEGAQRIEIIDSTASQEYYRFIPIKIAIIYFSDYLKYRITATES